MAGGNHILSKKNFSSHSDFASQYELSPAPFPPNIPLKSTSSRHKFLDKMQKGREPALLDMKSRKWKYFGLGGKWEVGFEFSYSHN